MAQKITILGSTGSIGVSTLDVIRMHPQRYEVMALCAHTRTETLFDQCVEFTPRFAVVRDASRPEQSYRVAPLAEFDPQWVDMHSIVIVGSSSTRMMPTGAGDEVMVTPRDYSWMEQK